MVVCPEYPQYANKKEKKLKPNDKCHCGSEKKYKKCCSRNEVVEPPPEEPEEPEADDKSQPGDLPGNREKGNFDEFSKFDSTAKVAGYRKQVEYGAKKYIKP